MAQFPLALAIEPRLLPHAAANGFAMDYKASDIFALTNFTHLFNFSIGTSYSVKCLKGLRCPAKHGPKTW
jgi:hypothetical protein